MPSPGDATPPTRRSTRSCRPAWSSRSDLADLEAVLRIAREESVSVIARGAGTSQNGQPIGAGLVVDFSRSLNAVQSYDPEEGVVTVEPGVVLERLNARLKRDGLFFPVEPSTASRCTIGGMTGNNSCGARSIFYGKMVDNVLSVDAMLPDGERFSFGRVDNVERRSQRLRPGSEPCGADARPRRPRARRDRGAFPEGAAPGRRLQPRQPRRAACRTSPICSSARKARSRSRPR